MEPATDIRHLSCRHDHSSILYYIQAFWCNASTANYSIIQNGWNWVYKQRKKSRNTPRDQAMTQTDEDDILIKMMDKIVRDAENNIMIETEREFVKTILDSGVSLYGDDENGNFVKYPGAG